MQLTASQSLAIALLFLPACARPLNPEVPVAVQKPVVAVEDDSQVAEKSAPLPKQPPLLASPSPVKSSPKKPRTRRTLDELILFQPSDASWGNYQPEFLRFEDVVFEADDGVKLHAWYCPCENPRAHVLFAHGNAGNVSFWAERMRELQQDYRVSVMIFEYRGYGKSEGKPTVAGVLKDARAAAKVLVKKAGIEESDLVVMGQSLGGAVAVHLAAEIQPKALILESTFSSFRDVADFHAKWASWLVPKSKLNSLEQIARYQGPLLQFHGDADEVVPFEFGEKLHLAANEPKTFFRMPGGGHNTPLPRDYRWKLDDFFDELAKQ